MTIGTIRDEQGISKVFGALAATDNPTRTQYFEIVNGSSQFSLLLVLCEGYDEQFQPPSGYEKDTGLTVSGTDVGPGTTQRGNIQPTINVWVTHGKCSVHWKRTVAPYDDGILTMRDLYSNKGEFFVWLGWEVVDGHSQDAAPSVSERIRLQKPLL